MGSFSLELVWLSQARPHIDLVFVHGYGRDPETTWHDETTGKTWIKDEEFVTQLKRPVRIFSFSYNSDVAANLSSSSAVFHASDLLCCLEQALERSTGRPVIFIAHGFGGIIVKRAIQLCFTSPTYPLTKNALSGVVFFGTPHADTDSNVLLQAVRRTVAASRGKNHGIKDEDMREYALSVSRVNGIFIECKPKYLRLLSFWEKLPTKVSDSNGDLSEVLVIPLECQKNTMTSNSDIEMDCDHERLPRFPGVFDARFIKFMPLFSDLIVTALSERTIPTIPFTSPRPLSPIPPREAFAEASGLKKPDPSRHWRKPPRKADDMYKYWERRKQKEQESTTREGFLRSLKGWSGFNYGDGINVALDTCEWFKEGMIYKNWLADPKCGTLFYLGNAGQGKTHLARAVAAHLKATQSEDVVISFFCKPGEEQPAVWDYFTWKLVKEWPDWISHVPLQYRNRDESSPRFGSRAFVEIWTSFREVCSKRTIFLIVDGLEQAAGRSFEDFFTCLEQLRQPTLAKLETLPDGRLKLPTKIKVVITSRLTDATDAASITTSRCPLPIEHVAKDVALYIDSRFAVICDLKTAPEVEKMNKMKEKIKDKAGPCWLYARFAVDEVEKGVADNAVHLLLEDAIPSELGRLYDGRILPLLQSVNNNDRQLRTALTLIASEECGLAYSVKQLESVLECLYGPRDIHAENLVDSIQRHCSDFLWIQAPDSIVLSTHISVRDHLNSYLSPQQRHTNMAFVCLKYLLQDSFHDRLPLSWTDKEKTSERISKLAPFYGFAAQSWTIHVSKLKDLSPELLPLLRTFLSEDCPQYQTWNHWRAWVYDNPSEENMDTNENPVMVLLRQGCLAVLQHLIPAPNLPTNTHWTGKIANTIRRKIEPTPDHVLASQWPGITGLSRQTVLMAAALSGNHSVVEHVLKWPVDMNARDKGGRTVLMLCLTSQRLMDSKDQEEAVNLITTLLYHGVNPNIGENYGITSLHVVCVRGKLRLARLLLDFGVRIDTADAWGYTPLERAYLSGNVELVETLIRRGADVDVWMLGGEPPLVKCIFDGNLDMFRVFLPFADVNRATMLGLAPIHLASDGADRIDFLRLLLTRPDLDVDAISSAEDRFHVKRTTAVCFAVNSLNYVALEMLLQAGAHPGNLPKVTQPPLHDAVLARNEAMVELLLFYGAPVNEFTHQWYPHTALGHAIDLGLESMVNLLLENGADPTIEEGHGVTGLLHTVTGRDSPIPGILKRLLEARLPPSVNYARDDDEHALIDAIRQGDPETVRLLLDHGIDISQWLSPNQKASPLHTAARKGHVEICEVLLQHEPKLLNLQFEQGFICESPLFVACYRQKKKVVRLLLDHGARADQLSFYYQESPLLTACHGGDVDIVKMLLEAAPQMVNVPSFIGSTPLIFACRNGKFELVKLLLETGANMSHRDHYGATCVSNQLFEAGGVRPQTILELLIQHGLDINAVDTSNSLTVLGVAIVDGKARHVKWMLEHGADPLRCQRGPGPREVWRNALQLASHTINKDIMNIIELLLEPQWGLLEHLTDRDWHGGTILPMMTPTRERIRMATRLVSICDDIEAQRGQDIFSALMNQPDISGFSFFDYASGRTLLEPSALPDVDKFILSRLEYLLAGPRTIHEHGYALDELSTTLITRGGYDSEATVVLEFVLTKPQVRWNDDGYYMGTVSLQACHICDDLINEPHLFCRFCEASRCGKCVEVSDSTSLHQHVWLDINLREDMDINAPDIQDILERLHKELSSKEESQEPQTHQQEADPITTNGAIVSSSLPDIPTTQPSDPALGQTSLQLATLHAFNLLAIRRPAWTPFLPLSPATQTLITPWEKQWEEQEEYRWRKGLIERRIMGYEGSPWRRFQEMQYFTRGLTKGYADEEGVRRDMILLDVGRLYDNEQEAYSVRVKGKEVKEIGGSS